MNKDPILMLLLFAASALILLSACQSAVSESAGGTAVSEEMEPPGPAGAEPAFTPVPTVAPNVSETSTSTPTIEASTASKQDPSATATVEPTTTIEPSPEPGILRTYKIVPEASEVRFLIDEELLGNPKTVVGRTNQVVGEIVLDLQNPRGGEVGAIQIDARDLATDDSFRNRALRRQILDSVQDEYQFITFTPTEIDGLSAEAAVVGEGQTFSLTGDLQIRDIVQSVTFEMMVTAVSDAELNGVGKAIVLRSNYGLQIPSVPGVANVSDEVKLEIDFKAESSEG